MFYSADRGELAQTIERLLAAAEPSTPAGTVPKAIIAPHAGYRFSGPVAGSAYARVAAARGRVSRVVLIGPSHRLAYDGIATSSASAFASPLGAVALDRAAQRDLLDLPQVAELDALGPKAGEEAKINSQDRLGQAE